jgi:hypothetical protein
MRKGGGNDQEERLGLRRKGKGSNVVSLFAYEDYGA